MQRIALAAVTDLEIRTGATPMVRIQYRRPGWRHVLLTAAGLAPTGVVDIDTSRIEITEISRTRTFALTIPTKAVRAVTGELNRRLTALTVGVILFSLGAAAIAFGIAAQDNAGWWPALDRNLTGDELVTIGETLIGLSVGGFLTYVFRRQLELRFAAGGSAGGTIKLLRSWRFPLRLDVAMQTIGIIGDIVLEAGQPAPGEPTRAQSDLSQPSTVPPPPVPEAPADVD